MNLQNLKMKVLFVANFRSPHRRAYGIYHGLRKQAEVKRFCIYSDGADAKLRRLMNQWHPDLLLFSNSIINRSKLDRAFGVVSLIDQARSMGIYTSCWICDLVWTGIFAARVRAANAFLPLIDFVFSVDGGNSKNWKKLGVKRVVLRQGIDDNEHIQLKPNPSIPVIDVSFIGSTYTKYRKQLVAKLQERYGKGFRPIGCCGQPRLWGRRLTEVMPNLNVVVGDSFPADRCWSNRVYEVTGRGGFFIHPHTKGMNAEFGDKKHVVYYERGNFKQLFNLIDYYLDHADERERIRQAGFKNCATYSDRAREMIQVLNNRVQGIASHY